MNALAKAQVVTGLRGFAAMVFTIAASPVLNAQGVSFQTISLGFGILYLILAAAEIPTGVWADVFGSKKSAVFGGLLQASGLVMLGIGSTHTLQILSGFAVYGLGTSFISGALSALMFGAAKNEDGDGFNSNRYFSMVEKSAVASYVIASVSVGFLSEWLGRSSFLVAAAIFMVSAVFVAMKLTDIPPQRDHQSVRKEFALRFKEGIAGIKKSLQLKILLPVRMLHQVETILGVLWLPWIRELGGSDIWFSVLATGSYLLRYVVNYQYSSKTRPESYMPRISFSLILMAAGSGICVFADSLWPALFGIWIMAGARGAFLPAVQAVQHEEFGDKVRTTGLSVINFSTEVMIAASYFTTSLFADSINVSSAWVISGTAFFIAFVISLRGIAPRTKVAAHECS